MKVIRFKGIDKEAIKVCNGYSYYINFDKIIDKEEEIVFQGDNENCKEFLKSLKVNVNNFELKFFNYLKDSPEYKIITDQEATGLNITLKKYDDNMMFVKIEKEDEGFCFGSNDINEIKNRLKDVIISMNYTVNTDKVIEYMENRINNI